MKTLFATSLFKKVSLSVNFADKTGGWPWCVDDGPDPIRHLLAIDLVNALVAKGVFVTVGPLVILLVWITPLMAEHRALVKKMLQCYA